MTSIIDADTGGATDDLTNIVTTNYPAGSLLLIRNANAARVVVCKHLAGGAGQFNLDQGGDYTLDNTMKWLMLQQRGTDWFEVLRGPQRPLPVQSPIINGSMDVWQRGTTFAAPSSGSYTADRWLTQYAGGVVYTVARSTTVPTLAQAGVVLNYSCELRIATADASIAAGDFAYLGTRIEGYNWRQFAQSPFTLSFWVMGAKTGTHCVAFRNNAAGTPDRCYIGTYSINSANTWEYKTITVSPSPSAGTWDYTTGAGLEVAFVLAAGSTFQTTAGAWNTGNFLGTSAQVNELDSTSNFFRITGVRMEARPIATPLAYVSFAEELARCQRYYQKSFLYGTVSAQNIGLDTGEFTFPSPVSGATPISCPSIPLKHMRAAPTVALYNPSATNAQFRNRSLSADCSSTSVNNASDKNFHVVLTTAASTSAGHTLSIHWQAVAEL